MDMTSSMHHPFIIKSHRYAGHFADINSAVNSLNLRPSNSNLSFLFKTLNLVKFKPNIMTNSKMRHTVASYQKTLTDNAILNKSIYSTSFQHVI